MRLHWSEIAEADLNDIHDYIARDVPHYANLFVERLLKATERLADFPESGRRVPEAGRQGDVREIIVHGFRVIYRITTDEVHILTVVHGRRDLTRTAPKPWDDE